MTETTKPTGTEAMPPEAIAFDRMGERLAAKAKPRAKVTTRKAAKPKAKPKAKATKKARTNRWTDEAKKKYRADIKSGRKTYASIAKDLGIKPQTAWAQLNR